MKYRDIIKVIAKRIMVVERGEKKRLRSRRWHHGPGCCIAVHFLKAMQHAKAHSRQAIEIAVAINLER